MDKTYEVSWSERSVRELGDIYAYVAEDSPAYALRQLEKLIRSTKRLERFPESGRRVETDNPGDYREVICTPYRLVYRILGAERKIEVQTVLHGSRDLLIF